MDTDAHEWESDLTEVVIGAAFEVANVRCAGFLEKVYERALIHELALRGVSAKAQVSFRIPYLLQSALPRRVCGRSRGRRKAYRRVEVRGPPCQ